MSDPKVADELCVYRGCQAESLNHPEALLHMNTGSRLGGDPWTRSLDDLWTGIGKPEPSRLRRHDGTRPAPSRTSELDQRFFFQPTTKARVYVRLDRQSFDLNPPGYKTRQHQRRALDKLAMLNSAHAEDHPEHAELHARMESYELAYRMQMSVPGVVDLSREPEQLHRAYGLDRKETAAFGKQCIMARKLVEQGVRFVQIFSGGWDSHDYLERGHSSRIASVDQPIAALIKDLKDRGMLDDTLVMWTGEFGRTPDNNYRGGVTALGRGHNVDAMNMWFAGGGVKRGAVVGRNR